MSLRKDWIRSVLTDAISDREEYLDAVAGIPEMERSGERDLAESRALLERYRDGARPNLSEADLKVLRIACRHALIWRESLLDSLSNQPESVRNPVYVDIRHARAVLVAAGGVLVDPAFANAGSISVYDLSRGIGLDRCTCVEVVHRDGVETRRITDRGKFLGTVERDAMGVVKLILADGKIINRPFEDASAAQDWLLRRFGTNLIFTAGRGGDDEDDLDEIDEASPAPGMR